jgi:hypothetical protein
MMIIVTLFCRDNLMADILHGAMIISIFLCSFICLVWLSEQIAHGGPPALLHLDGEPAQQAAAGGVVQELDHHDNPAAPAVPANGGNAPARAAGVADVDEEWTDDDADDENSEHDDGEGADGHAADGDAAREPQPAQAAGAHGDGKSSMG